MNLGQGNESLESSSLGHQGAALPALLLFNFYFILQYGRCVPLF